ncbi:uncharacterized protein LOC116250623 [Nymphaea colorata]|uniref:uncharacterized protein LOC116250623 n=1 Tax=Nymphaea colorata TaxID=210225 RepID=UPI00214E32D2|nr:uncharacterized protein LOC116250623 [Nymphaea colorata]
MEVHMDEFFVWYLSLEGIVDRIGEDGCQVGSHRYYNGGCTRKKKKASAQEQQPTARSNANEYVCQQTARSTPSPSKSPSVRRGGGAQRGGDKDDDDDDGDESSPLSLTCERATRQPSARASAPELWSCPPTSSASSHWIPPTTTPASTG